MTEHGLIFSGEMVRAIRDGRKSQTRRIATPHNSLVDGRGVRSWPEGCNWQIAEPVRLDNYFISFGVRGHAAIHTVVPRIHPGDLIWTKETWADLRGMGFSAPVGYRSDCLTRDGTREDCDVKRCRDDYGVKWRSPIHMPWWASREMLEVTEVRAQFLQDISQNDIRAEGLWHYCEEYRSETCIWRDSPEALKSVDYKFFAEMWDSLHAKPKPRHARVNGKRVIAHYESHPWQDIIETREHRGKPWYVRGNPPVWVYTFERREGQ